MGFAERFTPRAGEIQIDGAVLLFTLATATLGFFAVMLAKDVRARRRKWPYLAAVLSLAVIGFAHFYLGRASLSGLVAGWALGSAWLAGVGIAYRQRARMRP